MSQPFGKVPLKTSNKPSRFTIAIPETQLAEFRTLLKLSKIAAPTFESLQEDGKYGITHKWLTEAKEFWLNKFDWYAYDIERLF
jgi:microsomal epoxide hydrolase